MRKYGIVGFGNSLLGGDRTTRESDDSSNCNILHDSSMLPSEVRTEKDGSRLPSGDCTTRNCGNPHDSSMLLSLVEEMKTNNSEVNYYVTFEGIPQALKIVVEKELPSYYKLGKAINPWSSIVVPKKKTAVIAEKEEIRTLPTFEKKQQKEEIRTEKRKPTLIEALKNPSKEAFAEYARRHMTTGLGGKLEDLKIRVPHPPSEDDCFGIATGEYIRGPDEPFSYEDLNDTLNIYTGFDTSVLCYSHPSQDAKRYAQYQVINCPSKISNYHDFAKDVISRGRWIDVPSCGIRKSHNNYASGDQIYLTHPAFKGTKAVIVLQDKNSEYLIVQFATRIGSPHVFGRVKHEEFFVLDSELISEMTPDLNVEKLLSVVERRESERKIAAIDEIKLYYEPLARSSLKQGDAVILRISELQNEVGCGLRFVSWKRGSKALVQSGKWNIIVPVSNLRLPICGVKLRPLCFERPLFLMEDWCLALSGNYAMSEVGETDVQRRVEVHTRNWWHEAIGLCVLPFSPAHAKEIHKWPHMIHKITILDREAEPESLFTLNYNVCEPKSANLQVFEITGEVQINCDKLFTSLFGRVIPWTRSLAVDFVGTISDLEENLKCFLCGPDLKSITSYLGYLSIEGVHPEHWTLVSRACDLTVKTVIGEHEYCLFSERREMMTKDDRGSAAYSLGIKVRKKFSQANEEVRKLNILLPDIVELIFSYFDMGIYPIVNKRGRVGKNYLRGRQRRMYWNSLKNWDGISPPQEKWNFCNPVVEKYKRPYGDGRFSYAGVHKDDPLAQGFALSNLDSCAYQESDDEDDYIDIFNQREPVSERSGVG